MIGRMAMKKVYFPKVSAWGQRAVDELLKFPNARHDDFVDTLAWIGMGLGDLHSPSGRARTAEGLFPKVGTIEWVKWQTTMDSQAQKKLSSGF